MLLTKKNTNMEKIKIKYPDNTVTEISIDNFKKLYKELRDCNVVITNGVYFIEIPEFLNNDNIDEFIKALENALKKVNIRDKKIQKAVNEFFKVNDEVIDKVVSVLKKQDNDDIKLVIKDIITILSSGISINFVSLIKKLNNLLKEDEIIATVSDLIEAFDIISERYKNNILDKINDGEDYEII